MPSDYKQSSIDRAITRHTHDGGEVEPPRKSKHKKIKDPFIIMYEYDYPQIFNGGPFKQGSYRNRETANRTLLILNRKDNHCKYWIEEI